MKVTINKQDGGVEQYENVERTSIVNNVNQIILRFKGDENITVKNVKSVHHESN